MWVRFRKRWLLPIKWKFKKSRAIMKIDPRPLAEIYERREEIADKILYHDRRISKLGGEEEKQKYYYQGQVDILNWVLYGSSQSEGDLEDTGNSLG